MALARRLLGDPTQAAGAARVGAEAAPRAAKVAMIATGEVERVKNGTDLVALIQSRGVELRKKGRSWQGRCPFHADGKTPSLSVAQDRGLWKCFGCGKGGDAIR